MGPSWVLEKKKSQKKRGKENFKVGTEERERGGKRESGRKGSSKGRGGRGLGNGGERDGKKGVERVLEERMGFGLGLRKCKSVCVGRYS